MTSTLLTWNGIAQTLQVIELSGGEVAAGWHRIADAFDPCRLRNRGVH
jgi:hypothetical protein